MPGGQYTNLCQQAGLGLARPLARDRRLYAEVNQLFGDIVKVTPSANRGRPGHLHGHQRPDCHRRAGSRLASSTSRESVVEMMQGMLGQPEGGWPRALQKIILDSAGESPSRPAPEQAPQSRLPGYHQRAPAQARPRAARRGRASLPDVPAGLPRLQKHLREYDNISVIPTRAFFMECRAARKSPSKSSPASR